MGLRESVAEDAAHAATGGIHVALRALQAHLRGQIGLGLRRTGESEQREHAAGAG